jgi:hypothetical protein
MRHNEQNPSCRHCVKTSRFLRIHLGVVEEGIGHSWHRAAAHVHLCLDCEILPPHLRRRVSKGDERCNWLPGTPLDSGNGSNPCQTSLCGTV